MIWLKQRGQRLLAGVLLGLRKRTLGLQALLLLLLAPLALAQSSYSYAPVNLIVNAAATSAQLVWPGGHGLFTVLGTFNGATISLQYVGPDGTTLVNAPVVYPATSAACTAACAVEFTLPRVKIQATVSVATPSAIYATAQPIPSIIG